MCARSSFSFFETSPQTFRLRFRRRMSRAPIHFREFARIYEMPELEVMYSCIVALYRRPGPALKIKRYEKEEKECSINDLSFVGGGETALQLRTFTPCLLLISTMHIIRLGISRPVLHFFPLTFLLKAIFFMCRPSCAFPPGWRDLSRNVDC